MLSNNEQSSNQRPLREPTLAQLRRQVIASIVVIITVTIAAWVVHRILM